MVSCGSMTLQVEWNKEFAPKFLWKIMFCGLKKLQIVSHDVTNMGKHINKKPKKKIWLKCNLHHVLVTHLLILTSDCQVCILKKYFHLTMIASIWVSCCCPCYVAPSSAEMFFELIWVENCITHDTLLMNLYLVQVFLMVTVIRRR